ncbi:MAG TPA: hypothetical protein VHK26_13235, partial [Methyloceanibacter sp.]|nr:hypothetical protein [Methyloceanibacter sp.]
VGIGIFRIDFDRLVVVGAGAVNLALGVIGVAPVGVGKGIFRVDVDRLTTANFGAISIMGAISIALVTSAIARSYSPL